MAAYMNAERGQAYHDVLGRGELTKHSAVHVLRGEMKSICMAQMLGSKAAASKNQLQKTGR
ncbi:hypothetical protein [Acinetobacter sp.]|uniref:hypothetical protein n=1 Tax=Acinetobacter sp. TaxID=472 RepID=UPI0035B20DD8